MKVTKIPEKELKKVMKEVKNKIVSVSKREVKFATKEIFEMIQKADRKKRIRRNREVRTEILKKGVKYPVKFAMIHNDIRSNEMRVMFVANEKGDTFFQDMPIEVFKNLPTAKIKG